MAGDQDYFRWDLVNRLAWLELPIAILVAAPMSESLASIRPFWRREWILLVALTVICASVSVFLSIVDEISDRDHVALENRVLQAFRRPENASEIIGPRFLAEAARDGSALGGVTVTILISSLVVTYLLVDRRWRLAGFLVFAISGGALVSVLLKLWFQRARPTIVPYLDRVEDTSFPSGHSMSSAVVYITLGVLLARTTPRWPNRLCLIFSGIFLSIVVGVCRVILGVHYPSDVLAGWAAGTAWALLCLLAGRRFVRPVFP